jgi:hypothetical protein
MRRSITIAVSVAALASFAAYGSAFAQGVEVYVGPPAPYYYSPGPYVQYGYAPPAYGYYGYAEPGVVVYPRGRDVAFLYAASKPSHWPVTIRPQMIRICMSYSLVSFLPRTQSNPSAGALKSSGVCPQNPFS